MSIESRPSCYDVYAHPDDRAGFEAAQAVCRENGGGHLVQIEDQTESDFVSGRQFNGQYLQLEKKLNKRNLSLAKCSLGYSLNIAGHAN